MALPLSLGEPGADVGPGEVELEVAEDSVVESDTDVGTEDRVDNEGDVMVDDVGVKVEEGGVVGVGVVSVELGGTGDTGGRSVVLDGVGPP